MTEQAFRQRDFDPAHPFWKVQWVYDEEGLGGDFACTIGLSDGRRA